MMSYAGVDLPLVDAGLAEWIEKNISPAFAHEFDPGVDDNQMACLPIPEEYEPPPVRVGELYWPTGASRWGVFHTVVNGDQLAQLRTALSTGSQYGPANLVMDDARVDSVGTPKGTITAVGMTMLPPKPLSGQFPEVTQLTLAANDYRELNKLWLVTLVDDRFWWWFKQPTDGELNPHTDTDGTWSDYVGLIFTALGIAAPSFSASGYPLPKDRWHLFHRPLPLVLDAVATAIGLKVVRKLDGTVLLQSWPQALVQARDVLMPRQYAPADLITGQKDLGNTDMGRLAGGLIDYEDLRRSVPATGRVVWSDADNASFYDHSLTSLAIGEYIAFGGRTGELAVIRIDNLNGAENTATTATPSIWNQAARDWFGWRLANWDVTFGGVAQWDGCGWQDAVIWSQSASEIFTRVTKPPYVLGAGRGMCTDGIGSEFFFAKITGISGTTYSGVEVELDPALADGWRNKPGGRTFANDKGHRAPSIRNDPPDIPVGQVVLAQASRTKPGHYMLTPWGGQIRINNKRMYKVCVRCVDTGGGVYMLRTRTVYQYERWDARDLRRSLGLNTDVETYN